MINFEKFFIRKSLGLRRFQTARRIASHWFQAWYDLPVSPTHYYSPLPDILHARSSMSRWYRESALPGIHIDWDAQKMLLEQLSRFSEEYSELSPFANIQQSGFGLGYGEVEAHILFSMIRQFQPRKIIEVGSGVSTWFACQALEQNQRGGNPPGKITCIEPYPRPRLEESAKEGKVELWKQEVQDVPWEKFTSLAKNDVLFIDSSHVDKIDSDVQYLYTEVIPRLAPGVIIHIHDIAFPYPTFPPDHPLFIQSLLWNEHALARALLIDNNRVAILLCQSMLHFQHPDWLQRAVPEYDPAHHFPASLWIQIK